MRQTIKVFLAWLLLTQNPLMAQWKKVAQPYQDKMNYYSAAKAYRKVMDTGNIDDFIAFTRVLYSQGKYRETYENYKYLNGRMTLNMPFDLQAFRSCCAILGESLESLDSKYSELYNIEGLKGYSELISTINHEFTFQNFCANSESYEELCPILVDSQVIFVSSRPSVNGELGDYKYNEQPFYDLFILDKCKVKSLSGKYSKILPKDVNTMFHDGPAFYSAKKGMFFLTRNIQNSNGTLTMGIFYAQKLSTGWTKLIPLNINNVSFSVQHPYFDDSSETLYFSSNMNGGLGGFDLYKMKYQNGTWSEPQNLGPEINTALNEVFPYKYKGNLYFSSDGYKGKGGLDVYMVNDVSLFHIPGLNSPWDDFGLLFMNDSVGYISSNRNFGFGKDDILKFTLKKEIPGFIRAFANKGGENSWGKPKSANLKVEVVDAKTLELIESPKVNFVLINKLSGLKTELTVSSGDLDMVMGYFGKDSLFDFYVKVTHPDYLPVNVDFKDLRADKNGNIELGKIKMTQRENAKRRSKYPKIRPIYFDLDKFYIRKDAAKTLDSVAKIMKQYPNVHLEIRSFTDSRASNAYNKKLSENRAKSTVNYLAKKGISRNRMIYAGYGELGLVNDCGDDKKCIEKLHQENRRSELTLID